MTRAPFGLAWLAGLAVATASSAYEQPVHAVERNAGSFEIRRYAAQWVVETELAGGFDEARGTAFRRLFAYITGANRAGSEIAMTIPVVSQPAGERIAMTVPVSSTATADGYRMHFVLPSRFEHEAVPQPTDPTVRVRRVEPERVAVRAYSGRSNERRYLEEQAALLADLASAGLRPAGVPRFAVYNGPWTPWFMRRNEVIVPIGEAGPDPR